MRKYLLSFALIIAFALYVALNGQGSANVSPVAAGSAAAGGTAPAGSAPANTTGGAGNDVAAAGGERSEGGESGSAAPTPAPSPAPTPTPSPQPATTAGVFKDGSYTGPVADAFYGPMQVEAIVSGGKLSSIKVLQYPTSHGYSVEVNSYALPQLAQEAVSAQSANINIVSGATQSSYAFERSLAAALTQAKS